MTLFYSPFIYSFNRTPPTLGQSTADVTVTHIYIKFRPRDCVRLRLAKIVVVLKVYLMSAFVIHALNSSSQHVGMIVKQ